MSANRLCRTFGDAVFKPGRHLNVLIGPNGTGKSSMVSAIVLGMGGSNKIVSDKLKLQDFIKNGKEMAEIVISLYKNTRQQLVKFERVFSLKGRSAYKVSLSSNFCRLDYILLSDVRHCVTQRDAIHNGSFIMIVNGPWRAILLHFPLCSD